MKRGISRNHCKKILIKLDIHKTIVFEFFVPQTCRKIMKRLVFAIIIALTIFSCNQNSKETETQKDKDIVFELNPPRDGVFIHISEGYDDPHEVLMPMKMAVMMSEDKDVLVYMDIDAVNLLVKGAKDLNYADFESFQTYLKKLLDKNVGVYACPTCLKIAGFKPEDLMDGVKPAEKEKFFNFTNGRILTLDY